jgi:hypothetical protein
MKTSDFGWLLKLEKSDEVASTALVLALPCIV